MASNDTPKNVENAGEEGVETLIQSVKKISINSSESTDNTEEEENQTNVSTNENIANRNNELEVKKEGSTYKRLSSSPKKKSYSGEEICDFWWCPKHTNFEANWLELSNQGWKNISEPDKTKIQKAHNRNRASWITENVVKCCKYDRKRYSDQYFEAPSCWPLTILNQCGNEEQNIPPNNSESE